MERSASTSSTAPENLHFQCPICLEHLTTEADVDLNDDARLKRKFTDKSKVVSLHCGHTFHRICLEESFRMLKVRGKKRKCPLCRRRLNAKRMPAMIKIFPTTTTAAQEVPARAPPCKRCKMMESELEKLRKRNQLLQDQLMQLGTIGGSGDGDWSHTDTDVGKDSSGNSEEDDDDVDSSDSEEKFNEDSSDSDEDEE